MARRINYGFEKRQKEAKRKQKQADKLEKKRLSKEGSIPVVPVEGEVPTITDSAAVTDSTQTPPEELPS